MKSVLSTIIRLSRQVETEDIAGLLPGADPDGKARKKREKYTVKAVETGSLRSM